VASPESRCPMRLAGRIRDKKPSTVILKRDSQSPITVGKSINKSKMIRYEIPQVGKVSSVHNSGNVEAGQ
jgi:hypothetical protein